MKRTLRLGALLAIVSFAGLIPSAQATGVAGILFVPPYEAPEPTVISAVQDPCTINPPPVQPPEEDRAAGSFALTAGIDVTSCVNHAVERIDEWTLGDIPALLQGMPATIVADFEIYDSHAEVTGSGVLLEASIGVEIAGGRRQMLASERCQNGGCASLHKEGLVQLVEQTSALPETLVFSFHSLAQARNATGVAEATVSGTLRSVVVIPHVV